MYLQQDGASIYSFFVVSEWLDPNCHMRWIGRNCLFSLRVPRPPELTHLDFYFWEMVQNKAYEVRPRNRRELCVKIRQASRNLSKLNRLVKQNHKRVEKYIRIEGD